MNADTDRQPSISRTASETQKPDLLEQAMAISAEAAEMGFDWANAEDVLDKIAEETAEIKQALKQHESLERLTEEVGDLYFALVNFNRKMHIDTAEAMRCGTEKFERRFRALQNHIRQLGLSTPNAQELDRIWNLVKEEEKNGC